MNSIVKSNIFRNNRNLLLTNLPFLILLLLFSVASYRYYYNSFWGPFTISRSELFSIKDAKSLKEYYLVIDGDSVLDFGLTHVEQKIEKSSKKIKSESTIGYYEVLLIDDRLLILYTKSQTDLLVYKGSVEALPSDVRNKFINKFGSDIKYTVLPFMLDTTKFHNTGYFGIFILIAGYIFVFYNLIKLLRRYLNYKVHPSFNILKYYGNPNNSKSSIDKEFQNKENCLFLNKCKFSRSWLIIPKFYKTYFINLGYIVWIYKRQTKYIINFIPYISEYSAIIITRFGKVFEINTFTENIDKILEVIYKRMPWIFIGYSKDNLNLYRKNFSQFVFLVDERRKEYLNEK